MTRIRVHARRAALLGTLVVGLAACVSPPPPNKFVVFFSAWSGGLDDPANIVVRDAAAAALRTSAALPVIVAGYADSNGGPEANMMLSRLRAQRVADVLAEDGVPRDRIQLRPRGSVEGDPGIESRRVEIFIGG